MQENLDPLVEYARRLQARRSAAAVLSARDALYANLRLGCFTAILLCGAAALVNDLSVAWWATLPSAVYIVLAVLHDRVIVAHRRMTQRATYYELGMQRAMQLVPNQAWEGPLPPVDHPYAIDLDLFGPGGLFSFLCTAQTAAGQHALAGWLLAPDTLETVSARQAAAAELRPYLDLREELGDLGREVRRAVHPALLTTWAESPQQLHGVATVLPWVCNGFAAAAAVYWALGHGPLPFVGVMLLQWVVARVLRDRVALVMAALEEPRRELPILGQVIARLYREASFAHPTLRALRDALGHAGHSAAKPIHRLDLLGEWYDAQKNQVFAPVAWVLMWAPHFALRTEAWRRQHGGRVKHWLHAVGELEALLSLGGYAYEHPTDVFAQLVSGGPEFDGVGMAHPLLSVNKSVRNSLRLNAEQKLCIISGSNMSGKSTMLRTIGTNVVLAWAGAPVRCESLRVSKVMVGATLRVQDSIQTGTSRFYAEVRRLRQLMDVADAGMPPLLFLLDEILAGTNSHDRALGATAVLKEFLRRGAVGLVTTHDLSLTQEASALKAINVHFVDDLVNDKLHFDYHMRDGVVQKSNALALMRSVGLYAETPDAVDQ